MTDANLRTVDTMVDMPWDRLADYLREQGMMFDERPGPRQFSGGMGNLNYLISVDGKQMVLRRPPLGPIPPGANDMKREHRVLSRLWRAFPLAPRSLLYCESADVIGAHFLVMEYRAGKSITGGAWPKQIAEDAAAQHQVCRLMVETLAELHAVDPAAIGLEDFGRPDGFLKRAVEGWAKRAEIATDGVARHPTSEVAEWLRKNLVTGGTSTLLHNDFKLDNILFDTTDGMTRVAVLDWDQATRGDPLFDLATLLSYWTEPSDPEAMFLLDQMPTGSAGAMRRGEARDLYATMTGRDLSDFRFHRVLGMFKLAIVFEQLFAQYRRGTVTDPKYQPFEAVAHGVMEMAHDVARGRAD